MTTPQYDPKGLEAALEAFATWYKHGPSLTDAQVVGVILTAYHEATEPRSWEAELEAGGWLSYHASRLWVEKHITRNPGSFTGRIRALYPGPPEEVKSDG